MLSQTGVTVIIWEIFIMITKIPPPINLFAKDGVILMTVANMHIMKNHNILKKTVKEKVFVVFPKYARLIYSHQG